MVVLILSRNTVPFMNALQGLSLLYKNILSDSVWNRLNRVHICALYFRQIRFDIFVTHSTTYIL